MFVSCVCKRRWQLGGRKCRKMPESDICVCRKAKVVESHIVYMLKQSLKKKKKKRNFDFESLVLRKFRKITAISHPCNRCSVLVQCGSKVWTTTCFGAAKVCCYLWVAAACHECTSCWRRRLWRWEGADWWRSLGAARGCTLHHTLGKRDCDRREFCQQYWSRWCPSSHSRCQACGRGGSRGADRQCWRWD